MGVLSDGTPFLNGRGLAKLCGVAHSVIQDITTEWSQELVPPRVTRIREIVESHGGTAHEPCFYIRQRSGLQLAYPDQICIAILEYYAFDAGPNVKDDAKKNFRLLAGQALRDFIYTQVGYDPRNQLPASWKQFHDRVSLVYNSVPVGFFSVFKEIADMLVTLGQAGLHTDEKFVPDISVGMNWSTYWENRKFDEKYGQRAKYEHNYPDYFPQAMSNPQSPWCYPEAALHEFRQWFREIYIKGGKFENYLRTKVREAALPVSFAQLALAAYKK